MTLREIDYLIQRKAKIRSREIDFPTARILHLIANIYRKESSSEIPFETFMLNDAIEEPDVQEQMRMGMDAMKNFVKLLGGEVNL